VTEEFWKSMPASEDERIRLDAGSIGRIGCMAKRSNRLRDGSIDVALAEALSRAMPVSHCGRICLGAKKINFSTVFAGQAVGIKEIHDDIWLVSFMDYDLGYFDLETQVLEPLENPCAQKCHPSDRYVL